jgi:hypothetical protein
LQAKIVANQDNVKQKAEVEHIGEELRKNANKHGANQDLL